MVRKTYGDDSYRRSLEAELKDVRLSLGNIIKAVEAGALSEALMERLRELEERKQAPTEAIDAEKAKAELMADEYAIGTMFERYAHANLDDPQVRDDVLTYFIDKIYAFDDGLVITGDFVDYVGHDRYNREHYWSFNGFDTDFSSSKVFDLTELSSTMYASPRRLVRRGSFCCARRGWCRCHGPTQGASHAWCARN